MKRFPLIALLLCCTACAGWQRDCNSSVASSFGGDWIVLQYGFDGVPINCWKLKDTAISNEEHTDGVFWQDPGGHLVHISGWYNRVQVSNGDYAGAAKAIGISLDSCTGGKYLSPKAADNSPSPWEYYQASKPLQTPWCKPTDS